MSPQDKCVLSFYRELEPIGEAGKVFLVRHIETGQVFIKKRLSAYSRDLYRYLKAKHLPGVPAVYECLDDEDFIVVIEEYIGGRTLRQVMTEEGLFSEERAVKIVRKLCDTLVGVHNSGKPVVCRDLKPENIILTDEDNPYIIDFDAAKFVRPGVSDTLLLGTPGYAAPEQFGFAVSDERTDIYALGVIFNEMLIGALPQVKAAKGKYEMIIAQCTSLNPNGRPRNVKTLRSALGTDKKTRIPPLPGFRTRKKENMIFASITYFIILAMSFYLAINQSEDSDSIVLNIIIAIMFLFTSLWTVFYFCNYCHIRSKLTLTKYVKNWFLRVVLTIGVYLLVILLFFVLMTFVTVFFEKFVLKKTIIKGT